MRPSPLSCPEAAWASSRPLLVTRISVNLLRKRRERLGGEDGLHGQAEDLAQPQGEVQAGAVIAALQVADGLVVHTDRPGQVHARDPTLRAEDGQPVVDLALRVWHAASISNCCIYATVCIVRVRVLTRPAMRNRLAGVSTALGRAVRLIAVALVGLLVLAIIGTVALIRLNAHGSGPLTVAQVVK